MRRIFAPLLFLPVVALLSAQEVRIERSAATWVLDNGRIRLELSRTQNGRVQLGALRNLTTGHDWAAPRSPAGVYLTSGEGELAGAAPDSRFAFSDDRVAALPSGGKELIVIWSHSQTKAKLSLAMRIHPVAAVIEYSARLENTGSEPLPLLFRVDPLAVVLGAARGGLRVHTADEKRGHGFFEAGALAPGREFPNWIVVEDSSSRESLLVGGDMGAGVLRWGAHTDARPEGTLVRAGAGFRPHGGNTEPSAFEVGPGQSVETPISFLALSHGDSDNAGNEAFRYLRRYVFPEPVPNSPLATYCIWFTDPSSEEYLMEELPFARRMGFDVFYHDASWFESSSLVPGTNDWAKGLGSYKESREKFPRGLKPLADAVRQAGMKFGIWVDPGMVDAARVESGEIPESWLASIDGAPLESRHPSLALMRQLCLGNPEVVKSVKTNLSNIISAWGLEWLKWDPSGTVSHACNRTDHGHGRRNGAYAAYRGLMEIWSYLMDRYPNLSGFECDPSLRYSRTNPGPRSLLPGGYINEFITGPMASPLVWGSLYGAPEARQTWYSASSMDYHLREHFLHGVTFGNINGMVAQRLSLAPPGYIEAFKRNLLHFKQYRHLLFEDVYHPKLSAPEGWRAIQYVKQDASEAVLFVFRDKGESAENTVSIRGLDVNSRYRVTSLNERPGRERDLAGAQLASPGLKVRLPDEWLGKGDGLPDPKYEDQLRYGSDIVLLRQLK